MFLSFCAASYFMNYKTSIKIWEDLAQHDVFWAVNHFTQYEGDVWDVEDFLRTGTTEVNAILRLLKQQQWLPPNIDLALDFGCGIGRLTRALYPYFDKIEGVDASDSIIYQARLRNTDFLDKIEFFVCHDANLNVLGPKKYSFILSTLTFQYIPIPESMYLLRELVYRLKIGGILVFQVPVRDIRKPSIWRMLKAGSRLQDYLMAWGLGNTYQNLQPVCMDENDIQGLVRTYGGTILGSFYTNHLMEHFNGDLRFIPENDSVDYVSKLFVVKKTEAVPIDDLSL